jgi:predicted dehydrogenase/threonine dehydrogenase-like Zn-dependent dehydrogenase
MKQILQSFKTGETSLVEVPAPNASSGNVLIETTYSLVSLGTERMLVEFGKSNLVSKARQQPDKVRMVLDKIRSEGLLPTIETVFNKLEEPLPLGYCNVGKVIAVGSGTEEFSVGDRVASNGQHAEYVNVPKNLVTKIPDNVSDQEATFTVIGSIGLQGIRLCNPTYGETIVVIGLGLIGMLTAQMLKANGCRVIGVDIDARKCTMAKEWGIITINPSSGLDPIKSVFEHSDGVGADGVIISASSKGDKIISQAAQMSRKRGRIVLIGVVGLNINRAEFYEKELTFQVSCSYGPGRYDEKYEQVGSDYPLAFVRWTEKRNFEAVLRAISQGQLKVKKLISDLVPLKKYMDIYGKIEESKSIASILEYPVKTDNSPQSRKIQLDSREFSGGRCILGIIGAGNFTKMTLLPSLSKCDADIKYIASSGGVTGTSLAKKHVIAFSTTDYQEILNDTEVSAVIITTRHSSHASFAIASLEAGKHVFVEKPLALTEEELQGIENVYNSADSRRNELTLTVGYNRRFSPHIRAIRKRLGSSPGLMNIVATMNAGFIPANVWVHDIKVGGGRIVGEACHYIDLCVYLTGSLVSSVCLNALGVSPEQSTDNASMLLKFENGSTATINYFSNGAKSYSKERVEVFSSEQVFIVDNFRTTQAYGARGFRNLKTKIDKGHKTQFTEYIERVQSGGSPLIPVSELFNVTRASFAALKSLKEKRWVNVNHSFNDGPGST